MRQLCAMEGLELRALLSAGGWPADPARGGGGGGGGGSTTGPAIRLDLVALHEFGHALGLAHNSDPTSIMYPYYNPNYDLSQFTNDVAVQQLRGMYTPSAVTANFTNWQDALDGSPGNGRVDITYSFMLDGDQMDKGTSNTFATLDPKFGAGNWEQIFITQLNRWAAASNGTIAFVPFDGASDPDPGIEDGKYAFNTLGLAQHDSRFGDIRIATHRFDGAGKVLAHTYYPPPNGYTAAGDSHFDYAENWVPVSGASMSSNSITGGSSQSDNGSATAVRFSADLVCDEFELLAA